MDIPSYERGSFLVGIAYGVVLCICIAMIVSGALTHYPFVILVGSLGLLCTIMALSVTISHSSQYRDPPTPSPEVGTPENETE